jgi:hypothetical protein
MPCLFVKRFSTAWIQNFISDVTESSEEYVFVISFFFLAEYGEGGIPLSFSKKQL